MMKMQFHATMALLAAVWVLAPAMNAQQPASEPVPDNQVKAAEPQLQERYPRYIIQRQDVLAISFPISPELNQTVTVQPDGYVNLQGTRSVHVEGLTVPGTIDALKTAYAGVLHNPIINVDLKDFQKPKFTVTGQVGRPGQFELRSDLTVAEALAVAGGLAPSAKSQVFLFHRTTSGWFKVEKLDIKDVLNGKHMNEDAMIRPGDMVFVPEKFISNFRKYVPYSLDAGTYLQPTPF